MSQFIYEKKFIHEFMFMHLWSNFEYPYSLAADFEISKHSNSTNYIMQVDH
jgi:hypothetical protein